MTYPSAMQYAVELERARAKAAADARLYLKQRDEHMADAAALRTCNASLAEQLRELREQLAEAREGAEWYAAQSVKDWGEDTEEACPPWITVPDFCAKYGLELPEDWYRPGTDDADSKCAAELGELEPEIERARR